LRLLPVYPEKRGNRPELSEEEAITLKQVYVKRQTEDRTSRAVKKRKENYRETRKKRKDAILAANMEYKGFKWLLDRHINTEDCIFYSHSREFCFGWRGNGLSKSVKDELLKKLEGFPFPYEIK